MSELPDYVPAYMSPLTDKEHARLGRIAVLWGQVEYCLDEMLPFVSGLKRSELDALAITDKAVGSKAMFLKAAMKRVESDEQRKRIGAFLALIEETKVARNHAFHGVWGWRITTRTQSVMPCARHGKYPSRPLKIADLAKLEKSLCACSRIGRDVLNEFWGWHHDRRAARFFHGADDDFPEWFHRWTERNPMRGEYLDQTAKAGQLPRLAKHFPHK
jgi:hypothetical protein